jgi:hypothetical protein
MRNDDMAHSPSRADVDGDLAVQQKPAALRRPARELERQAAKHLAPGR